MCHIIVTLKSHKFDNQYITIEKPDSTTPHYKRHQSAN
jgi:hypothetical protein